MLSMAASSFRFTSRESASGHERRFPGVPDESAFPLHSRWERTSPMVGLVQLGEVGEGIVSSVTRYVQQQALSQGSLCET